MILALNLNVMMKSLALDPCMRTKRMKAIRFSIINIPCSVINLSLSLFLRLSKGHPSYGVFVEVEKLFCLTEVWYPQGKYMRALHNTTFDFFAHHVTAASEILYNQDAVSKKGVHPP